MILPDDFYLSIFHAFFQHDLFIFAPVAFHPAGAERYAIIVCCSFDKPILPELNVTKK